MRNIFRKTVIGVALLAPLTLVGGIGTANATGPNVAAVVGAGTVAPGLTTVPTPQTAVTFTGILTVDVGTHTGTYSLSFDGASTIDETVARGQGAGTLTVNGEDSTVTYDRNVNLVIVSGEVSFGSDKHKLDAAACVFVPTSANPTTSYALVCAAVNLS